MSGSVGSSVHGTEVGRPPEIIQADTDWTDSIRRRMLNYTGIVAGTGTFGWDNFDAVPSSTNFGERWRRSVGGGSTFVVDTARNGGVIKVTTGGAFEENSILLNSAFVQTTTARWAVAFKSKFDTLPGPNVNNLLVMGLADARSIDGFVKTALFGLVESVDGTFCTLNVSGSGNTVTTYRVTNLSVGHEIMLVGIPGFCFLFIDNNLVKTVVCTGVVAAKPYWIDNQGIGSLDAVAWMVEDGFGIGAF